MKKNHCKRNTLSGFLVILIVVMIFAFYRTLFAYLQKGLTDVASQQSPTIKNIVNTISEEELKGYIIDLQNMGTRYTPSKGSQKAALYIHHKFRSFGLDDVFFDAFTFWNEESGLMEEGRNIIATKRGALHPEKVVILGAHFDTIARRSEDELISPIHPEAHAPGADDNATGVAVLLGVARALSSYQFDYTIRFIAFSAEEEGILGSASYARRAAEQRENIVAMINVDMVGYQDLPPEDIDIIADENSIWLLDTVIKLAPHYTADLHLLRVVNRTYDGSDHAPFWNNGYSAICLMEDYLPTNPLYHAPTDTIEIISILLVTEVGRLMAASLCHLAEIMSVSPPEAFQQWAHLPSLSYLILLNPGSNLLTFIDITSDRITSLQELSLGEVPPDTWGTFRSYPMGFRRRPQGNELFVSCQYVRRPASVKEKGELLVLDLRMKNIIKRIYVGEVPTVGDFTSNGSRYYLPHQGEKTIKVIDCLSYRVVEEFPIAVPISKLVISTDDKQAYAISGETGKLLFLDLRRNKVDSEIAVGMKPVDIVIAPDNQSLLILCQSSKQLVQVSIPYRRVLHRYPVYEGASQLLLNRTQNRLFVLHHSDRRICQFSCTQAGEESPYNKLKDIMLDEFAPYGMAGKDGRVLYLVSPGRRYRRVFAYNLEQGTIERSIRIPPGSTLLTLFSY